MAYYGCPSLQADVELTDERAGHITENHPDLLPEHAARLVDTLADPDSVRRNDRSANTRLFTRWFADVRGGKHVVVVVASETAPVERHWVVTAYLTRRLAGGVVIEWAKN